MKLEETQGEGVELADSEALPHCEREGVKLVEPQAEPLELVVTEVEKEGENVAVCVAQELLLTVALSVTVAQALCEALPHCERDGVKLEETHAELEWLPVNEEEEEGVRDGECVPLGLPLAEELRDEVAHALCEALPHSERDGVKLEEAHAELERLPVKQEELEGVHDGECVPLGLPLAEELRDAVAHALCVALPHCEREGVKLAECVALPHRDRVGEKLAETQAEAQWLAVIEEDEEGDNVGEYVPLTLPLDVALCDGVPHALSVALPLSDCKEEKLAETHEESVRLTVTEVEEVGENETESVPLWLPLSVVLREIVAKALGEALPHWEREGVKLAVAHAEPLGLPETEEEDESAHDGE